MKKIITETTMKIVDMYSQLAEGKNLEVSDNELGLTIQQCLREYPDFQDVIENKYDELFEEIDYLTLKNLKKKYNLTLN